MISEEIFHKTYNARHLAPAEVAETFIWSESFKKLLQNNHSVILGARGCGKTTLMKMLTLPALYNWKSSRSKKILANIPFYGIYVSTDIYWDVKNHTYNQQLEKFGNFSELISIFSVTTNVFSSLCDTFINVVEFELDSPIKDNEVEVCYELIEAWKLNEETIPTFIHIKEALNKRIDNVNQFIQNIIFNHNPEKTINYPNYFNLSFESSLEFLIPIFERVYKLNNKKWSLCFDELEFAPLWLQEKLFKSLRSRKHFILYKLSASPILSLALEKSLIGEYRASSGNDVTMIKMWSTLGHEKFSKKIIQSLLQKRNISADDFFGSNPIYNRKGNSYIEGSSFYYIMLELIAKDDSFRNFLIEKKVDINKPIATSKDQLDSLFRKIKPIVYHRNSFIARNKENKEGGYTIKERSRKKTIDLYSGIEVFMKVCEGNPRWLIGITSQILASTNGKIAKKSTQYNELKNAGKKFKNVLANIPIYDNDSTLTGLIEKIGKYLKNQILGEEFRMDPYGTFEVDKDNKIIKDNILKLIEIGVSQGALLLVDSDDHSFDFEIRGQRLKVSYLFYVLFDLPLRKYNKTNLSECFSKKSNQPSLFNQEV